MKKRTGIIFLVLGGLLLLGAVAAVAVGAVGLVEQFKPVTLVTTPGHTDFEVDQPGPYTLWHDHTIINSGVRTSLATDFPPDFTFTLTHLDSGVSAGFKAFGSSTTQTMNTSSRESVGLGTFQVTDPGPYRLEASNPAGDQRFLSLTEGTILSSIGGFFSSFGIAALLGLLGIGGLIAGFIGVLAGRKSTATSPPPAS